MMNIVALAGGVGGAKLVDGLSRLVAPADLTVVVNTGDDFDFWGLRVCPDLDTVCYTLAGLSNPITGWGRVDETWKVLQGIRNLEGPGWFQIGDKDLATHLERTRRLKNGETLSQITRDFCRLWEIPICVLPMTDEDQPTWVETEEAGWLPFQEYFVKERCEPTVKGFAFRGLGEVRPAPGVVEAILAADVVVFCPSNPWVSIDPILAVPGIEESIRQCPIRIGVSPIIGGKTIKGPAAKMFSELGIAPSARAVSAHYHDLLTDFVVDDFDQAEFSDLKDNLPRIWSTNTIMTNESERKKLAQYILDVVANRQTLEKSV